MTYFQTYFRSLIKFEVKYDYAKFFRFQLMHPPALNTQKFSVQFSFNGGQVAEFVTEFIHRIFLISAKFSQDSLI